jgi:hypothetical protein
MSRRNISAAFLDSKRNQTSPPHLQSHPLASVVIAGILEQGPMSTYIARRTVNGASREIIAASPKTFQSVAEQASGSARSNHRGDGEKNGLGYLLIMRPDETKWCAGPVIRSGSEFKQNHPEGSVAQVEE